MAGGGPGRRRGAARRRGAGAGAGARGTRRHRTPSRGGARAGRGGGGGGGPGAPHRTGRAGAAAPAAREAAARELRARARAGIFSLCLRSRDEDESVPATTPTPPGSVRAGLAGRRFVGVGAPGRGLESHLGPRRSPRFRRTSPTLARADGRGKGHLPEGIERSRWGSEILWGREPQTKGSTRSSPPRRDGRGRSTDGGRPAGAPVVAGPGPGRADPPYLAEDPGRLCLVPEEKPRGGVASAPNSGRGRGPDFRREVAGRRELGSCVRGVLGARSGGTTTGSGRRRTRGGRPSRSVCVLRLQRTGETE